jgi:hypothetical protein
LTRSRTLAVARIAVAVVRRPDLWPTAVRQTRRMARPHWWRRRPFLPVPASDYLQFRLVTQYGETDRPPMPGDVVDYLRWCRTWERSLDPRES